MFYYGYHSNYHKSVQRFKKDSPLDLLQKRYASGEIKVDEYLSIKRTLEAKVA